MSFDKESMPFLHELTLSWRQICRENIACVSNGCIILLGMKMKCYNATFTWDFDEGWLWFFAWIIRHTQERQHHEKHCLSQKDAMWIWMPDYVVPTFVQFLQHMKNINPIPQLESMTWKTLIPLQSTSFNVCHHVYIYWTLEFQ